MLAKFKIIVLSSLILSLVLGQATVFGSRASDRRDLMKETLKIKKQQVTGVVEEEPEKEKTEQAAQVQLQVEETMVETEEETAEPVEETGLPEVQPEIRKEYSPSVEDKHKEAVPVPTKTVIKQIEEIRPASGDDELLRLIPSEAMFCIRINNLDESLMSLDKYLMGISPVGTTTLVKQQLGQIIGDPMLEGINTEGNFAIFGIKPWAGAGDEETSDDPIVGMIVPTTGGQFTLKNPNSKIASDNFGLIVLDSPFEHAGGMLKEKVGKRSIISRMDEDEYERATESPIWAFGNAEQVNKDFRDDLNDAFVIKVPGMNEQKEEQKPMTLEEKKEARRKKIEEKKRRLEAKRQGQAMEIEGPTERSPMDKINEQNLKMVQSYLDFLKSLVMDADFASITITPSDKQLDIKCRYAAETNTQLAKWLSSSAEPSELKLAAMLSGTDMFNIAARVDKESLGEINEFFMDMLISMSDQKQGRKIKTLMNKSMESAGNQIAGSFSLTEGQPPFRITSIVEVNDSQTYRQVSREMTELMTTGTTNPAMPMPISVSYEKEFGQYNGIPIDKMLISFNMPENSQEAAAINQMYGAGMDYRIAYTDNLDITIMGPYADEHVRKTIDKINAGQLSGDMNVVMNSIPNARYSSFAGSFNLLRLFEGLAGAVKSLPMPAPQAMIANAMFDGLGQGEPESCLCFAGNTQNGRLDLHILLPKEHLAEVVPVITQIQQRQMHMMQQ